MSDAIRTSERHERILTAAAAVAAGEIYQLPDGRAAVHTGAKAAASGDAVGFATEGVFKVTKTASVVMLDGAEIWWDHSADAAILKPAVPTDKDFFLGTLVGDAASAATSCYVNLNVRPNYIIDLVHGAFVHAPVLTAGTPVLAQIGGGVRAAFSATAEAQKLDMLSQRSFPVSSQWILDAVVCVRTNADADVGDLNVGVANGTHASDADAITESCFAHFDMGADLNIDAESDDGTTEVNATDTTVDWAVGTPVRITIDGRTHSDIQIYVNGVLVLGATVFTLAAATGPLKALFHLEKSSNDSPGEVELHELNVRLMEV
ncbi:MAG: DUF2190 family protein [Phycisphaerales bacterium]|nr:DUF2190 family protein [Phycisphaerales bacterium]